LVVGLGNPGAAYAQTRHNMGFMVVDEIARRAGPPGFRRKFDADVWDTALEGTEGTKVLFCKPMAFMNVSGPSVAQAATFWKIPPEQAVVVHDDLDLAEGRLKVVSGGGHGGHNGLRSITASWGTQDFWRLRVGIGRPPEGRDPADYVLDRFASGRVAESCVSEAADAVELMVRKGPVWVMNKFNVKKKKNPL
jgi:PTH1 family peptidyl-tRNA hydrolase